MSNVDRQSSEIPILVRSIMKNVPIWSKHWTQLLSSVWKQSYNDEDNKIYEVVEWVGVLDHVHNISPALQWYNLVYHQLKKSI